MQCFYLEPSEFSQRSLDRFVPYNAELPCYHRASKPLDRVAADGPDDVGRDATPEEIVKFDWPTSCNKCGYVFTPQDEYRIDNESLWVRKDTGQIMTLRNAGPGAMWNAKWRVEYAELPAEDGLYLQVNCPNGVPWEIDGRANNCDSPCANCSQPYNVCKGNCPTGYKDSRPHKCWVRHGIPPQITVDKNGITCGAGGGSIQAGDYHGFLVNGVFVLNR